MDILYVVGRGFSQWNDNELRYSLRSIAKNGKNIGRVFIAGYCPPFVNRNAVTYLKVKDETNIKHHNILHCIDEVVKHTDIGEEFLYSSDDHFYIRETDFNEYPFFRKGILPDVVEENDGAKTYHQSLVDTRKLLTWCGLPFNNYAWHGNTHFRRSLWESERFQFLIEASKMFEQGVEPTCLMLNYWQSVIGFEETWRADCKFHHDLTDATFEEETKDRECISASNAIRGRWLESYLTKTFPKKCKYEI